MLDDDTDLDTGRSMSESYLSESDVGEVAEQRGENMAIANDVREKMAQVQSEELEDLRMEEEVRQLERQLEDVESRIHKIESSEENAGGSGAGAGVDSDASGEIKTAIPDNAGPPTSYSQSSGRMCTVVDENGNRHCSATSCSIM